ncbi:DNA recombination protein RmuC [endosymbiont GvMRE of Glomus versiforme]|uniref:DNA recombination protein RmuC n=1 Tax=endosymbiont GvMRE of Glomus versiforme TaxID=2039283 RepID=UPI000EB9AB7C|nr:DNA recombination protein RmuC [endosymbiont GvMRE of Glomus versiforme]RHZ36221.1 RmuC domain protein [endosymbiont GvMRE of Glomus versiforme]
MDVLPLTLLIIIIVLLIIGLVWLFFFLLPKKQEKQFKLYLDSLNKQKETSKFEENNEETKKTIFELKEKIEQLSQKLETSKEVNKTLLENVDKSIKGEIANQQKLFHEKNKELTEKINKDLETRLNSNQQLIKTHLENLNKGISQPLERLNNVLLQSDERGRWGNTQLDQLLSLYLQKNDRIYQTEFKLKKKRTNGEGLRVDAIVFSADNRNNIAIDSKFPLKNYLTSTDSNLTEKEQKEFEKKFENDVKEHINKVAEYVSDEDGTKYAIMFVPSEVIFSKINEQRYYNIVEVALKKRVSICSPAILLVIIDQLQLWNKIWEQYKDLDKITSEITKFWDNLKLFKERWDKIVKAIETNNEAIRKLNISTRKLIEGGERIKNRESASLELITDIATEETKKTSEDLPEPD